MRPWSRAPAMVMGPVAGDWAMATTPADASAMESSRGLTIDFMELVAEPVRAAGEDEAHREPQHQAGTAAEELPDETGAAPARAWAPPPAP